MQAPDNSGSMFFNYKKTFSIVLLAVCDAKYQFTLVDIGESGRKGDSGIYSASAMGTAIDANLLNFLDDSPIPGYKENLLFSYAFVGDEGFALKSRVSKCPWISRSPGNVLEVRVCPGNVLEFFWNIIFEYFQFLWIDSPTIVYSLPLRQIFLLSCQ